MRIAPTLLDRPLMTLLQRVRASACLHLFLGFGLFVGAACTQTTGRPQPEALESRAAAPVPLDVASGTDAPAQVAPAKARPKAAPTELYDVVKVVDGDTIHVKRNGKVEKLRLLSVDTEEQLSVGTSQANSTKPPTVFGEECAIWARAFFAGLASDGKAPQVGLAFPNGIEKRDVYGRLLCDVILPDGTNYNLMLVEKGKSPYFDKYGWSETDHEAYVAAQKAARAQKIGIWDPRTNMPTTPGAPAAKRPYDQLLPWWDARAVAIDAFRKAAAQKDAKVCDVEDAEALARAVKSGERVRCFGEVGRVEDQGDGAVLVHFRATEKDKALVVRVPKEVLAQKWSFDLRDSAQEFHQNYVWLDARVTSGPGASFRATFDGAKDWQLAGPQVR
jgi:micrococcal nuclease